MKIAVIGGGLFGCTAAIYAARAGHDVTLFEAKSDLMLGATAATFARLHRGYHYPRSPETGQESRDAEDSFRAEYGEAVIDGGLQSYVVAPVASHVTAAEYRAFLHREWLPFFEDEGRFDVVEARIHLARLQAVVRAKVAEAGITLRLGNRINARAASTLRERFDRIVVATYARINGVLAALGCAETAYKFQLVEKPVIRLGDAFKNRSIVVIDGPFGCIDPLDDTPFHVLGHVTKLNHSENVGAKPATPDYLAPFLDRGIIAQPRVTRLPEALADLARYIPGIEAAEHIGSAFTVRAVLAHQETTDARPTLVERLDAQVIRVFSGKLGTAVKAADEVLAMIAPQPNAETLAAMDECRSGTPAEFASVDALMADLNADDVAA